MIGECSEFFTFSVIVDAIEPTAGHLEKLP